MRHSALLTLTLPVAALLGCTSGADDKLSVTRSIEVAADPTAVWEQIGDFCAIQAWHPAVTNCEISEEGGETYRLLTLADGATIKERHTGPADVETSYTYAIVEGPLPVENYTSSFIVNEQGNGSEIIWSSSFDAAGASDEEAQTVIIGIYEAGLDSIGSQ